MTSLRVLVTLALVAFGPCGSCESARAQGADELIDRTLAIVGGQVITLSDVQTAQALGLIASVEPDAGVGPATERLIERTLILREVQRYAPPEPADAVIDEQVAEVRARFSSPEPFTRVLEVGGFSAARLRAWVRDDLRIASYLSQRFAAAGLPSDEDVSAYYASRRDEFERDGMSFDRAAPVIRDRLSAERRGELISDWTADLRRRTTVVELWK